MGLVHARIGKHRWWFAGLIAFQSVSVAATLYLPAINADLIDNGLLRTDVGHIWTAGGWMVIASVVQLLAAALSSYAGTRAATDVVHDLRSDVYDKVATFSNREHQDFGTPTLITRSTDDLQQIQTFLLAFGAVAAAAPLTVLGGAWMAFRTDTGLSLVVVVAVVLLGAVLGVVLRWTARVSRRIQDRLDAVNRVLHEQLMGLTVIRAFTRERFETERFGLENAELAVATRSMGRLNGTFVPAVMLVTDLSILAVVWFGGHRVTSGHLPIGGLTACITYLVLILGAAMTAAWALMMLPRALVAAERIRAVRDAAPVLRPPGRPTGSVPIRGGLELRGVTLRYPGADADVLSGIDLTVEPGSTVAIVGSMGAGKTTLLSVVAGLQDATSGSVRLDGVDLRSVDPSVLRGHLAIVPQRSLLFRGTVASNLRLARPDATDAELWEALEVAQAREFVAAMDDGLRSPIVQGGTNVSGGQRQRLCIARALVAAPRLLLLDDPVSALDPETSARLLEALRTATAGTTVLLASQRTTGVSGAERIVVLHEGGVVGDGTHPVLLDSCRTYQELVAAQDTIGASA
ncbi:ATP-binding cassette subfamily B protein [Kitasatospora sp. SolWspMP-SS2h]|uniref:ABC transporter ATP-binding protein n=1 Tax=Kitasatospora sp. SolWspMP-SS2h TaxID=1305729 RepID=UPI000DBA19E8|nr:ABC transporter ATP-binding protein [Kitasatospora sp. SolWspMP-SS2h]RAJ43059.1 ATP-binding cassette subfamily B protein [Kitasatospora sp. SolWspMP-SS2h]